jgi:hypothetical protein
VKEVVGGNFTLCCHGGLAQEVQEVEVALGVGGSQKIGNGVMGLHGKKEFMIVWRRRMIKGASVGKRRR